MSNQQDKDPLETVLYEQRNDHEYTLRIYERAGSKENILLTAAFAVVVYLYGTPKDGATSLADKLFIPPHDYGAVIYAIAAGFLIFGIGKLIASVFGDNIWETPYETSKTTYPRTSREMNRYFKGRYDASQVTNLDSYNRRKANLSLCFFTIMVSSAILIIIKTLQ